MPKEIKMVLMKFKQIKLGLKTALKEAVAQGAERIAWTTGEQQNERYDLSKQEIIVTGRKMKMELTI